MKNLMLIAFFFVHLSINFQDLTCSKSLDQIEISLIQKTPFSNSSKHQKLLNKILKYSAKKFPEIPTKNFDCKIRISNKPIFDFYGITDEKKIDEFICNIKKQKQFKLPRIIIVFHSFDSGEIITAQDIY